LDRVDALHGYGPLAAEAMEDQVTMGSLLPGQWADCHWLDRESSN
jgi:hypothetical protein